MTLKMKLQAAVTKRLIDILPGPPNAVVPQQDSTGTVLTWGYDSLAGAILDPMIVHKHCPSVFRRIQTRSARHQQALENAIVFQAEVKVGPPRAVQFHKELSVSSVFTHMVLLGFGCVIV